MKKIVAFTGAGISKESGIATFRDVGDGLWYNHNIDEVATAKAWAETPEIVMDFHNMLRSKLKDSEPNGAHIALADLEKDFDVTVITQNVDDLHERAGSTKILHLHGELYKSRSVNDPETLYECLGDLMIGDLAPDGGQLRPHTVLFDEYPYNMDEAYAAISQCDYLLIIGTSLQIGYTPHMIGVVSDDAKVYYIDPAPTKGLEEYINITYVKKKAVEGVTKIVEKIINENIL